jgi:hypothetical protein
MISRCIALNRIVVWLSPDRAEETESDTPLMKAPEICVEIISPGNTVSAIGDKRALYFGAGAKEVWICKENGKLEFQSNDVTIGCSVTFRTKHKAVKITENGDVLLLCGRTPRKTGICNWTLRDEMVTCRKCRKILRAQKQALCAGRLFNGN